MKSKHIKYLIDRNLIQPETINKFNGVFGIIDRSRTRIIKKILQQIYAGVSSEDKQETIDINVSFGEIRKFREPFHHKESVVIRYLNQLRDIKRVITNYSFTDKVKTVSLLEKEKSNVYYVEQMRFNVTVRNKEFLQFFEKEYGKKVRLEEVAPKKDFSKYLRKDLKAPQLVNLLSLFVDNKNKYINTQKILEFLGMKVSTKEGKRNYDLSQRVYKVNLLLKRPLKIVKEQSGWILRI